jgi:hypothetical protein
MEGGGGMKCPHCGKKLNLGELMNAGGKGTPKTISKAERKRRADSLSAARAKRWPHPRVGAARTAGSLRRLARRTG